MLLKSLKSSLIVILFSGSCSAQFSERYSLSDTLQEISGLEMLDDSTFLAINDGGNDAIIYVLNRRGKILRSIEVEGAKNKDWEDLTSDGRNLYIADIGNNDSKRKNLSIWKIKLDDVRSMKPSVSAKEIKIRYADQTNYPPSPDSLFYDAEALLCKDDSLWILTKTKSNPWDGRSFIYKVPTVPGEYELTKKGELCVGLDGWWSDAITGADYCNGYFYILTYNRIQIYTESSGILKLTKEILFNKLTQKESIKVMNKSTIFVADEKQMIFEGGSLYRVKTND